MTKYNFGNVNRDDADFFGKGQELIEYYFESKEWECAKRAESLLLPYIDTGDNPNKTVAIYYVFQAEPEGHKKGTYSLNAKQLKQLMESNILPEPNPEN